MYSLSLRDCVLGDQGIYFDFSSVILSVGGKFIFCLLMMYVLRNLKNTARG